MAVGKFGPPSALLYVDGYDMLSAKPVLLREKQIAEMTASHGLGDSAKSHAPTGLVTLELAQEGAFFDTSSNNSHDALSGSVPSSAQQAVRILCLGFAGQTIGYPFVGFEGLYSHEYEVLATQGDLQKANVAYSMTGKREPGQILQPLQAKTADWDTESTPADYTLDTGQQVVPITSSSVANPTVITTAVPHGLATNDKVLIAGHSGSTPALDATHTVTVLTTTTFTVPVNVTTGGTGGTIVKVDSANGGTGFLQVTAASGFTNFVGKVRDSPDDITYADLITFTDNVSAPFAERLTVSGTVDRYTAFDGNVTGSGSITVFCGFSRS